MGGTQSFRIFLLDEEEIAERCEELDEDPDSDTLDGELVEVLWVHLGREPIQLGVVDQVLPLRWSHLSPEEMELEALFERDAALRSLSGDPLSHATQIARSLDVVQVAHELCDHVGGHIDDVRAILEDPIPEDPDPANAAETEAEAIALLVSHLQTAIRRAHTEGSAVLLTLVAQSA
ncbi:MAG: hypothetical protein AAGE52_00675 [Myxococcota bacterium]